MSVRLQRARYIRYCFVGVLILLDLFALLWALFFPLVVKLHGIVRAPAIWLRSLSLFGGNARAEVRMNTKYIVQLPMVNTPAMGM
jgi:hypothetical protein